ncbi:MAG: thioredoxin family protein, partial [Opitutaceae bacterium]
MILGILLIADARGADTRPVLGPGATRDAVIDTYGWPDGQSHLGDREIFTYPQGRVVLNAGVVERMDFSPNVAWPVPKPRPGTTAPVQPRSSIAVKKPVVVDLWLTDFAVAVRQAQQRHAHILALFTGIDWSPPSKKFQDEVAQHPEFVATVGQEYVLLR